MGQLTTKERDAARFMALDGAVLSGEAGMVVSALAHGLVHQRRSRPTKAYEAALAAIVCAFLRAAEGDASRWSFRPLRPEAFTGERIGYRTFKAVLDDLSRAGMVEVSKGQQQWLEDGFSAKRAVAWSRATRVRPTAWLLRYLESEGDLRAGNWADHFKLLEPARSLVKEPVVVRRRSVRHKGEKHRGFPMRVDLSVPGARAAYDRMERLNRFYSARDIAPSGFRGLRRIYNNGEMPSFDWNKGGRLYAVGGGYQTMKKAERAKLAIDGESVVEIDVKGSFINILAALRRMPLEAKVDPYEIEGLPRPLVKAVVTMTLGHSGFHARWPSKVKSQLEQRLGVNLAKDYPLKKVLPLIASKLPALAGWGDHDITCFDLQFVESEAMLLAVERLAYDHGVTSLPVHDSLIVPASRLELAQAVLAQAFEDVAGHRPQLVVDAGDEGGAKEGDGITLSPTEGRRRVTPSRRRYTGNAFAPDDLLRLLLQPHRKIIELLEWLGHNQR